MVKVSNSVDAPSLGQPHENNVLHGCLGKSLGIVNLSGFQIHDCKDVQFNLLTNIY